MIATELWIRISKWVAARHYVDLYTLERVSRDLYRVVGDDGVWFVAYRALFPYLCMEYEVLRGMWRRLLEKHVGLRVRWHVFGGDPWRTVYTWQGGETNEMLTFVPVSQGRQGNGGVAVYTSGVEGNGVHVVDGETVEWVTNHAVDVPDGINIHSKVVFAVAASVESQLDGYLDTVWLYNYVDKTETAWTLWELTKGRVQSLYSVLMYQYEEAYRVIGTHPEDESVVLVTLPLTPEGRVDLEQIECGVFGHSAAMDMFHCYADYADLVILYPRTTPTIPHVYSIHQLDTPIAILHGLPPFTFKDFLTLEYVTCGDVQFNKRPVRIMAPTSATMVVWNLPNSLPGQSHPIELHPSGILSSSLPMGVAYLDSHEGLTTHILPNQSTQILDITGAGAAQFSSTHGQWYLTPNNTDTSYLVAHLPPPIPYRRDWSQPKHSYVMSSTQVQKMDLECHYKD